MRLPSLTYANVVATLALFLALGGAAYAATQLPANSVGTRQLKTGAVTAAKLKSGAVTESRLSAGVKKRLGLSGAQGPEGREGKQGPEGKEGKEGKAGGGGLGGESLAALSYSRGFYHLFSGELAEDGDEIVASIYLGPGNYLVTGVIAGEAGSISGYSPRQLYCGLTAIAQEDELDAATTTLAEGQKASLSMAGAIHLEASGEILLECITNGMSFKPESTNTQILALPVSTLYAG